MRWSQEQRLRFIDSFINENGQINRADIIEKFDVSVPQASLDLKRYQELVPKNMTYNKSEKMYLRGLKYYPLYSTPSEEDIGARARHNKKNPVISFRVNSIDPDGNIMPALHEKFGDPINWAAVVEVALRSSSN